MPESARIGTIQPVFLASNRTLRQPASLAFSGVRGKILRYARIDVAIPPAHKEGRIEWPRIGKPDPARHFVVAGADAFPDFAGFDHALHAAEGGKNEVIVFIHGYNTNNPEAVYRLAQMAHDFDADLPVVSFSWPSGGDPRGYVYDRDSVIFSRDALEDLLLALTRNRKVMLVAHSMGSQLVMETLRQISIGGRGEILRELSGVALISPDIDPDVFLKQAERIVPLPEPFLLMTSARDRILDLAAWVAGRPRRLGAITSSEELAGLPVFVWDVSEFTVSESAGHDTAFTAPRAIEFIRNYGAEN